MITRDEFELLWELIERGDELECANHGDGEKKLAAEGFTRSEKYDTLKLLFDLAHHASRSSEHPQASRSSEHPQASRSSELQPLPNTKLNLDLSKASRSSEHPQVSRSSERPQAKVKCNLVSGSGYNSEPLEASKVASAALVSRVVKRSNADYMAVVIGKKPRRSPLHEYAAKLSNQNRQDFWLAVMNMSDDEKRKFTSELV